MVHGLRKTVRSWFEVDLRALALMRIGFALNILVDLALRARDLTAFYTDQGVMPRASWATATGGAWKFCLHLAAGTKEEVAGLFMFHAVWAILLLLGWRTTLSTVICWLMTVSLQMRQLPACNGGDSLLRAMLFWGIFLPWGAVWSLDARRKGGPTPQPAGYLSFGSCALVLQLCLIYWVPVALRSSPLWWNGEAVQYSLLSLDLARDWGKALAAHSTFLKALGVSVIYSEVFGPLLLFSPFFQQTLRAIVVCWFVLLHLGMMVTMDLGLFPLICIAAWLGLLPTCSLDSLGKMWTWVRSAGARKPNERISSDSESPSRLPIVLSAWRETCVAGFLVLVLLSNLETVDRDRYRRFLPSLLRSVMNGVRLNQYWALFTPGPPRYDGYFAAVATLKDGKKIDLLEASPSVRQRQTGHGSLMWVDLRWRKYLGSLGKTASASSDRIRDRRRFDLLNYLVKEWNRNCEPGRRVARVALTYVWRPITPPDYGIRKTQILHQAVWDGKLRPVVATKPKPAVAKKPTPAVDSEPMRTNPPARP